MLCPCFFDYLFLFSHLLFSLVASIPFFVIYIVHSNMLGRVLQRSRPTILRRWTHDAASTNTSTSTTKSLVYVVFGGYGAIGRELCTLLHEGVGY